MRLIDKIITGARLRHCVAFIDDITTHGKTWEQYVENQKATLMALADARWLVTVEKMYLGYDSVEMLGDVAQLQSSAGSNQPATSNSTPQDVLTQLVSVLVDKESRAE